MQNNAGDKPAPTRAELLHEAEMLAESERGLPYSGYLSQQITFIKFEAILGSQDAISNAKTNRFIRRLAKHCKERSAFYSELANLLERASEDS
jgi:hypothetical protein